MIVPPGQSFEVDRTQPCPQQTKGVDCGLFTVTVTIHIVKGVEVRKDTFTLAHIMKF